MFKSFHSRRATARTSSPSPTRAPRSRSSRAEHGFRRVFDGDPDIGGRYSALSCVRARPGRDRRATTSAPSCDSAIGADGGVPRRAGQRRACGSAAALGELALQGRDKLTFVADAPLSPTGCGPSSSSPSRPASRAAASCRSPTSRSCPAAEYGDDRVFLHVALGDAENAAGSAQLNDAGHPVITIRALGPADLGRIFFLSEFAVAVAGWALEINPFDQPNVQEAKDNTNRVLDEGSPGLEDGSLSELTDGARAAALPRDHGLPAVLDETEAAVARLRERAVRAPPRRHDLGLRPALPALDRAVPQGRPEGRRASCRSSTSRRRTSRSPASRTRSAR